jgi:hypothetical protein
MKITSFNGDYEQLSELIQRSWAENGDSFLRYTPEFLQNAFAYPDTSFDLCPCIYDQGRLEAFMAGLPRHVIWNGNRAKLILSTLLTSSPERKGKGYGAWLWLELVKRSRRAAYDGMISISVQGGPVNRIVDEGSRMLKLPSARVFQVRYLSLLLNGIAPAPAVSGNVDLFLKLASKSAAQSPLRRVWSLEEAEWQCCKRSGAITAQEEDQGACGMITGYVAEIIGPQTLCVLNVEDVLWDELPPDGRNRLLRSFLAAGVARGAQVASVPVTNATNYQPFKEAGFRSIRRLMNIYLTSWKGTAEPAESIYLDVF